MIDHLHPNADVSQSDVMGFIHTMGGGIYEHTHSGVCSFMHELNSDLGVKVLYLTSRPLRLVIQTKQFLQGKDGLHLKPFL